MSKFAKYQYSSHPAIRRMLVEERCQALVKAQGLLEIRLARAADDDERQRLADKIAEVRGQIGRLRRLTSTGGGP